MKKAFIIVLLLAALGFTLVYFNQRTCNKPAQPISDSFNRDLLIGKWRLDSIAFPKDSNSDFKSGILGIISSDLIKYHYEFKNDGIVTTSMKDSLVKDSSHYEWNKDNQLVWKQTPVDTTADVFTIPTLSKDSLVLQSSDSTSLLLFTKAKE